jgi:hypothetical protein
MGESNFLPREAPDKRVPHFSPRRGLASLCGRSDKVWLGHLASAALIDLTRPI